MVSFSYMGNKITGIYPELYFKHLGWLHVLQNIRNTSSGISWFTWINNFVLSYCTSITYMYIIKVGQFAYLSSSITLINREKVFLATFFFFSLAWWNLWKRYRSLSMSSWGVIKVRYVVKKASWYINSKSTQKQWH